MATSPFDTYTQTMKGAHMPSATRSAIKKAIQNQAEATDVPRPRLQASGLPHPRFQASQLPRRALAVAACTLALIIGGLALSHGGPLSGYFFDGVPSTNATQDEGTSAQSLVSQNGGFVLKAYADGLTKSNGSLGNAVDASSLIMLNPGWSVSEAYDKQGNWDGSTWRASSQWTLNLTCIGNDVEKITFSLPETKEEILDKAAYGGVAFLQSSGSDRGVTSEYTNAVTITPGESSTQQYDLWITVNGAAGNDLDQAQKAMRAADAKLPTDPSAWNEEQQAASSKSYVDLGKVIARLSAQQLAETTITATATMKDGSTVAHVYRLSPVEDFDAAYLEQERMMDERLQQTSDEQKSIDWTDPQTREESERRTWEWAKTLPALFTVSQIS